MKFFLRVALGAAAGFTAGLSACASGDEPVLSPWVEDRVALAAQQAPPAYVPAHSLAPGSVIQVRATTRRLMERGDQVRERAALIAGREVNTGAFVEDARRRGKPPEAGSR